MGVKSVRPCDPLTYTAVEYKDCFAIYAIGSIQIESSLAIFSPTHWLIENGWPNIQLIYHVLLR